MQGKLLIILKSLPHMNELNSTSATIQIKRSKGFFKFKQTNPYIHLTKGKAIYFHGLKKKFHVGIFKI